jgi:hypothetical protein
MLAKITNEKTEAQWKQVTKHHTNMSIAKAVF